MRGVAALVAIAVLATAGGARAEDAPAPAVSPAATTPSPASEAEVDELRAALARQQARIDALEAAQAGAPLGVHVAGFDLRLSGFLQIDWVAYDQAAFNQIGDSSGTLLNQDRFTLRRGHARLDARSGYFFGA